MPSGSTLPKVLVLATGGTIAGKAKIPGSVTEYVPGSVAAEELLAAVPQLAEIADPECVQVANMSSQHMDEPTWRALAAAISEASERGGEDRVDGVVILHGTDTMEETALFLDCVLAGRVTLPVVLTGSMLPGDAVSADGPGNMLNAVRVAVHPDSVGRGVFVLFANKIHEAARVYKGDSLAVDGFQSACGRLGGVVVDGDVRYFDPFACGEWPELGLVPGALPEFPEVGVLYAHAGMREKNVDAFLKGVDWAGIVYAGVGMGNIHDAAKPGLLAAMRRGIPVVCSTRVDGSLTVVKQYVRADGFLCANRLNPQKARVLLQLALMAGIDGPERLQALFDMYL